MDLIDAASRLTRVLPEPIADRAAWHLGQHASRKTRIARLRTGGRVAVDVGDHLHRTMFFRGVYEPAVTRCIQKIAKPGWSVADVGANVGYFSVLCADLGGVNSRVVAFEPHPRLGDMLAHTASLNPRSKIAVEKAACGSKSATATLYVSPEDRNSGLGSLRDDLHNTAGVEVRVVRLDAVCDSHGMRPDLVKIDAEGFEREVLEGCGSLLTTRIPECFIIEVSPHRDDPHTVIDMLHHCGYEGFQIGPDGSLIPITSLTKVYEDLCFVRNQRSFITGS